MKKLAIACVLSASLIFSSIVVPSSTALALEPTDSTVEKNIACEHITTKDGYRVYVVNGYLIKIPASNAEPTQAELRNILQEQRLKTEFIMPANQQGCQIGWLGL